MLSFCLVFSNDTALYLFKSGAKHIFCNCESVSVEVDAVCSSLKNLGFDALTVADSCRTGPLCHAAGFSRTHAPLQLATVKSYLSTAKELLFKGFERTGETRAAAVSFLGVHWLRPFLRGLRNCTRMKLTKPYGKNLKQAARTGTT